MPTAEGAWKAPLPQSLPIDYRSGAAVVATGPDAVITPTDTSDVAVATLSYGVGNWYLARGDTARARTWFERSVGSGGWPAFGFILSEVELRRLR